VGLSGLALRRGEILVCADSETDERVDRATCRQVGARSILVAPLMHEGASAGTLKVYAGATDAFSDAHARVLALLANTIGSALLRADLVAALQEQANTDQLTGLPNRRAWYARLDEALARSRRHGHAVSVIVLDLDDFKQINDSHGHGAGDERLIAVSGWWSAAARASDVVGRTGGDEFAVICEHADPDDADEIGTRLRTALPIGQQVSVGRATWDGAEDADDLVARADAAMYEDKQRENGASAAARRPVRA
jgi:diguanylate cyclase (GGDEF)-like protein